MIGPTGDDTLLGKFMRVNLALGSVSTALLIAWGAAASPASKVTPSRLAERGDLIVVGEVVAVDAPTELDLQLPHMDRPAPALYRRYHVSVGQLVKTTGASPGGTIGVLAKSHGTLPPPTSSGCSPTSWGTEPGCLQAIRPQM